MINKKSALYITLSALVSICSVSYGIFDRPAEGGRAGGLDIDYTDQRTGETRRRFAPVEAIFGGHDQTDKEPRRKGEYHRKQYDDRYNDYDNQDYRN